MKTTLKNISTIVALLLTNFQVISQSDSINQIDDQNRKQGHWVFSNSQKHLPGYTADQTVEEGDFVNNKKEGKWTFYFNNGKPKHILSYKGGTADGEAIFYYKNVQNVFYLLLTHLLSLMKMEYLIITKDTKNKNF